MYAGVVEVGVEADGNDVSAEFGRTEVAAAEEAGRAVNAADEGFGDDCAVEWEGRDGGVVLDDWEGSISYASAR